MPKVKEGTLKIRASVDDVKRFIEYSIEGANDCSYSYMPNTVDNGFEFYVRPGKIFWVRDTRKMYVTEETYVSDRTTSNGIAVFHVVQNVEEGDSGEKADIKNLKKIAKDFNADIALFLADCLTGSTVDIRVVHNGSRLAVKNREKTYENWEWDFPFPELGGLYSWE